LLPSFTPEFDASGNKKREKKREKKKTQDRLVSYSSIRIIYDNMNSYIRLSLSLLTSISGGDLVLYKMFYKKREEEEMTMYDVNKKRRIIIM